MDLHEKIIIKVQFNDEIRKMPIHNEEITFDELLLMMARVFKHKLSTNEAISIKYKDEDGDLITLADDSDLSFALASSNVLRLVLSIPEETESEEEPEKIVQDAKVLMMVKELQNIRNGINKILDKFSGIHIDTSVTGGSEQATANHGAGDFNGVRGKEFDPLSSNSQVMTQNERAASVASSLKQEEIAQRMQNNLSSDRMDNDTNRQQQQQQQHNMMMQKQHMPENEYSRQQQHQQSSQPSNMMSNDKKINEPKSPNKNMMPPSHVQMPPNYGQMPPTHNQMPPGQPQGLGMPPNVTSQHNQHPGNMSPANCQQNMGAGMPPPTSSNNMMPPTMGHPQNMIPTSQAGMVGMPPSGSGPRPPISAPNAYSPQMMNQSGAPPPQMMSQGPPRMMPPPSANNSFRPPSSVSTTTAAPSMMYNPRATGPQSQSPIMRPPTSTQPSNTGGSGGMIYPPNMPPAPGPGGNYFNPQGIPQPNHYQQQYQK